MRRPRGGWGRRKRVLTAALAWLALPGFGVVGGKPGVAEAPQPSQYDVEAAYLYNFAKFVRWPAAVSDSPLKICVMGQDPFGAALDEAVGQERIEGRRLAADRLTSDSVHGCSVLFISNSEEPRVDRILAQTASSPVLTVSDMPGFLEHGGMIQFLVKDDRVRFGVNLDAANRAGVTLSSQLLKVAASVVGQKPTEAAP
jgi:hypothetical protein